MRQYYLDLGKKFQHYDATLCDEHKAQSFKAVLCKAHAACCAVKSDDDEPFACLLDRPDEVLLRKWLSKGHRLGLETVSVLQIGADRVARRRALVAAVLQQQQLDSHDDQALRQASRDISRASRLFAWRCAYKQATKDMS